MYNIIINPYTNNNFCDNIKFPIIFLGFNVKSSLDESLSIPIIYNPFKITHFSRINADIFKNFYYYGIEIYNKNKKINELIEKLNIITKDNDIITLETYKNLLSQYGLSCKNCYLNYKIGCFPLDLNNLYYFISEKDAMQMIEDFLAVDKQNNTINNVAGIHLQILTQPPIFNTFNCRYIPEHVELF